MVVSSAHAIYIVSFPHYLMLASTGIFFGATRDTKVLLDTGIGYITNV